MRSIVDIRHLLSQTTQARRFPPRNLAAARCWAQQTLCFPNPIAWNLLFGRCDPWSVCYKKDSQAWGYRMRMLSSIFPQHSLSYKMSLRFQQLYHTRTYIPFDKPAWSSSCHATKCHCDFHDGLTWLKWLLYKMIFTSLSYKILDLDFISGLAWLKWKHLYSACGHKLCRLLDCLRSYSYLAPGMSKAHSLSKCASISAQYSAIIILTGHNTGIIDRKTARQTDKQIDI